MMVDLHADEAFQGLPRAPRVRSYGEIRPRSVEKHAVGQTSCWSIKRESKGSKRKGEGHAEERLDTRQSVLPFLMKRKRNAMPEQGTKSGAPYLYHVSRTKTGTPLHVAMYNKQGYTIPRRSPRPREHPRNAAPPLPAPSPAIAGTISVAR